ncbi:hypothetical protein [Falsibacillus pallidus]|uniref:Uncharacterized protein n=1 Tax=Falsibacillus pallidus TaxID=493781 RepID=A0A370GEP9_9BACI|nr:hypothetical protein [Falsibacillus pallidus]RDI42167.1 hypothetical protein DFR59_1056 [Falsibacillus pallidus]
MLGLLSLMAFACLVFLFIGWAKRLENNKTILFLYFLGSCLIYPVYSVTRVHGQFRLWFPVGFLIVLVYLIFNKNKNKSKFAASILGLSFAAFTMLVLYNIGF